MAVNQVVSAEIKGNVRKDSSIMSTTSAGPAIFIHPPYKERACSKCHTGEAPSAMAHSQDNTCYACHKDYTKEYEEVHGPVAGGFCTQCHTPHQSLNKKLLVRTGQNICLPCHTLSTVMKNETHADIDKTACTECHDPHGGGDRYFSK